MKKYNKKNSYYKHLKFDCGKDKPFYCNVGICGYSSNRKENVKKHIVMQHKLLGEVTDYIKKLQ